jgi:class 3 adenylate cyclase
MSTAGTVAPKRVLVVDDSPLMRRLITEIVAGDPDLCVVDVAENGKVALEKVRALKPDCVLLDIEMPELSGLDTLRRLRLRSDAKVVILSHLGQEGSRVRAQALRLGAVDVIDKPGAGVSPDLRHTRGRIIQQTLRRALGLPAAPLPDQPLAKTGALTIASIMAVDVQHFASLRERLEATALVKLLDEQLALIHKVTTRHGGMIDTPLGATTLVAFGVPERRADHAARAVAAAAELVATVAARQQVELGIAVVTGLVLAGELGPPAQRRYRTIGDALPFAARLARASEDNGAGLVICGQTLAALPGPVPSRRLDVVQLEADSEPLELYEVLSPRTELDAAALETYARGMQHYEAGQFAAAMKAFDELLAQKPADRAAARLSARCRLLLSQPRAAWRGVWPWYDDGGGGGG